MQRTRIVPLVLIAAFALLAVSAAAEPTSHRAIINFEKSVKSDGEVNFTFSPEGRDAIEVKVRATKGVRKSSVADQARRLFDGLLSSTEYEVKLTTDSQLLIKKKKNGPLFDLTLGEQTVEGLRVSIKLK